MPYLYGIADTKFYVRKTKIKKKVSTGVPPHKFRRHEYLAARVKFNHDDVPIQFRVTPSPLVELCVAAVDKLPLPSPYEWDYLDVRRWIKRYGYPQYMNTFDVNLITGRKLLLLDATALTAMNIKDFKHIRHISYGIRMLFHFELTKFSHSISQPDEKPYELYLLFHTQTGIGYDEVRRSDLFRRMQLIRERPLNLGHWDLLELWLRRERERKYTELVGAIRRLSMYKCHKALQVKEQPLPEGMMCTVCIPPCECDWTERDIRQPWRLTCLPPVETVVLQKWPTSGKDCIGCIPPCECCWPSRYYLTGTVLRCLQQTFPEKFCPIFDERMKAEARPSLVERWTRFSF